jgi:outer membrane protein
MKISLLFLLAIGLMATPAFVAQAQAEPELKIAVVDMAKLYETHWQTKAQMAKLKTEQQQAASQFDQMTKDLNTMVQQYKDLDEQSKDPMTTADAKAKAQADAQKLLDQIRAKANDRNTFGETVQREFQQRIQNFHSMMIDQITQKAVEIAKEHGATLLLDESGVGLTETKSVLYAAPSFDITAEVAAAIAKEQPASDASASGSASSDTVPIAPSAAPASSDTPPPITVPGVTAPSK